MRPAWVRRRLLELVPSRRIQKCKDNCDSLHRGCVKVFEEKKKAVERGDDEVLQNAAEGRDVMSVLCECVLGRLVLSES